MPLVRIDMRAGRPAALRRAIADTVYQAMVEAADVPLNDRFIVVGEHGVSGLHYDPSYLGVERSDGVVFIQITLSEGRSVEKKRALYRSLCERLHELGVRREDVFVSLVEVAKENWSFGNGIAQYVSEIVGPSVPAGRASAAGSD